MVGGGDSGPAVVPGKPAEACSSPRSTTKTARRCRPTASSATEDIEILIEWINRGAPWPKSSIATRTRNGSRFEITDEDRAFWSFQPIADPPLPEHERHRLAANDDRSLCSGSTGRSRPRAVAAGRQAHADPPRDVRPDRPAADARGDRRVPGRRLARCLRPRGRSPARLAALRRALGPALARRGPLRRGPGPHVPGPQVSRRLPLPRLGRQGVQRRPAVRPIRHGSRSPPTCSTAATQSNATCRRWASSPSGRSTTATAKKLDQIDDRIDTLTPRLPGPDGRLRPLPRPQVRSDLDERLLRPGRRLRQHRVRGVRR